MTSIIWRRQLLREGFTSREVRRLVRTSALHPVRRGAYARDAPPREPEALHLVQVRAAVADLAPQSVVSHVSAAIAHGLPVWGLDLRQVHVTRARPNGARRGTAVHSHGATVDSDEIVECCGVLVTSPARTVCDLARWAPLEQAVVVADAALHTGLVTPAELAESLARSARRPGNAAARRAVSFADGLAESVGESRSRAAIARAGLPAPVLQQEMHSHRGHSLGRVDIWWPEWRLAGEFDGRVKYGRLLEPGQDPGDAVWAEKIREDAIRDTGALMVRWTWADLATFDDVVARIRHLTTRTHAAQPAGAL